MIVFYVNDLQFFFTLHSGFSTVKYLSNSDPYVRLRHDENDFLDIRWHLSGEDTRSTVDRVKTKLCIDGSSGRPTKTPTPVVLLTPLKSISLKCVRSFKLRRWGFVLGRFRWNTFKTRYLNFSTTPTRESVSKRSQFRNTFPTDTINKKFVTPCILFTSSQFPLYITTEVI